MKVPACLRGAEVEFATAIVDAPSIFLPGVRYLAKQKNEVVVSLSIFMVRKGKEELGVMEKEIRQFFKEVTSAN